MEVRNQLKTANKEELTIPSLENCVYTSCYCEENVWMLCDHVRKTRPEELANCHAVFISNSAQTMWLICDMKQGCNLIPLWCQRASKDKQSEIVIWDYHVIFIVETDCQCRVYDMDTTLPFPCDFQRYTSNALKSDIGLNHQYHRSFRVIPASQYLHFFASDRSHMRNDADEWLKQPPDYPCIETNAATNNLSDFISMDASIGKGEVLTLDKFLKKFNRQTSLS